jgi:alcohol dehydrogenase
VAARDGDGDGEAAGKHATVDVKTRAAVLRRAGLAAPYAESKPLVIEEVTLDAPGAGEVLVRIAAAGLCHSDLSVVNGDRPRPLPMVIGHEAAGIVEELGAAVTDLARGDHVVMVFVPSCGACVPCMSGRPALCEPGAVANGAGTLLSGTRRLHGAANEEIHHHIGVSCFAERAVVSRRSLVKIDPSLPLAQAALFGCAVLTGVGAVVNTAKAEAGSTIAVVGLGGVGLNAILGAHLVGARRIVAIDIHDDKLELAQSLGATDTFNARDPECAAQVRDRMGGGVDFAFEMAGAVSAMELAYAITRRGGTTVTAGLSNPTHELRIKHVSLVAEERTIKGSYIGSAVPMRDIPRYIDLFKQGRLPVDLLLSAKLPLTEINTALDALAAGHVARQVIEP